MCQKFPHRVAVAMWDLLAIITSILSSGMQPVGGQAWGEPGLLAGQARAAGRVRRAGAAGRESQGCWQEKEPGLPKQVVLR